MLEAYGIRCEESLRAAHQPPDFMEQGDGFISIAEFQQMAEFALKRTQRPWLGLEIGQKIIPSHHGPLGQLVASSETCQVAIDVLIKYLPLRSPLLSLSMQEQGVRTTLQIHEKITLDSKREVLLESFMIIIVNVLEFVYGKKLKGLEVAFNYPTPAYYQHYQEAFSCPVHFNCRNCLIYLDSEVLSGKNILADPIAHRMAEIDCEKLYHNLLTNQNLKLEIENLVLKPSAPFPPLEKVAESLNMSKSTFIRKMHKANTSYKEIVENIRRELCHYYLIETDLSIEVIADKLGYKDTSNFSRVFKRWHNSTPKQFRQAYRGR